MMFAMSRKDPVPNRRIRWVSGTLANSCWMNFREDDIGLPITQIGCAGRP